jgi:hypothetical protein
VTFDLGTDSRVRSFAPRCEVLKKMVSLKAMPRVGNWTWGVPLIVANVLMHVVGLRLIGAFVLGDSASILRKRTNSVNFVMVVRVTALLTISLHGFESSIWGAAYVLLRALSDKKTAMLYSLEAMTTHLAPQMQRDATDQLDKMFGQGSLWSNVVTAMHVTTKRRPKRW